MSFLKNYIKKWKSYIKILRKSLWSRDFGLTISSTLFLLFIFKSCIKPVPESAQYKTIIVDINNNVGIIKEPDKVNVFYDWFIDFVLCFGFIGTIWTILSRFDSFKASETAEELKNAFASAFPFSEIFQEQRLSYIINNIGEESSRITLFLGFPYIGLFHKNQEPNTSVTPKEFKEMAFKNFMNLKNKIRQIKDSKDVFNHEIKYTLNIAIFSKNLTAEYLKSLDDTDYKTRVSKYIDEFYSDLEAITTSQKEKFRIFYIHSEIGLRFATYTLDKDNEKDKTILWTVADFTPKEPNKFEGQGFQSRDSNFIMNLNRVYDSFYKSLEAEKVESFEIKLSLKNE